MTATYSEPAGSSTSTKAGVSPAPGATIDVEGAGKVGATHLNGLRTFPLGNPARQMTTAIRLLVRDSTIVALRSAPFSADGSAAPAQQLGVLPSGRFKPLAKNGRDSGGPFKGVRRQITDMSAGGGYVVWAETPALDGEGNEWTIRSVRLSSGQVRTVAHSRYLTAGHRLVGALGSTVPVVLGHSAYWATAVPTNDHPRPDVEGDWSWQIQRKALDGNGSVHTVATNAAFAAVTDGALVYATRVRSGTRMTGYQIHRRAPSGDDAILARGALTGTAQLTNLAAGAGRLVWTVSSVDAAHSWTAGKSAPGSIYVMDVRSGVAGKLVQIRTADEVGPNYSIGFAKGLMLWGNGSGNGDPGEYLLNLATDALYRLGAYQGSSLVIGASAGRTVMWMRPCPTTRFPARSCWAQAAWAR